MHFGMVPWIIGKGRQNMRFTRQTDESDAKLKLGNGKRNGGKKTTRGGFLS